MFNLDRPLAMMNFSSDLKKNRLLAELLETEWEQWLPQLEEVDMPFGQVLYDSDSPLNYAYFPTTSIVSLLSLLENGASFEIAVVGNDGVVGCPLFMGGESTLNRAVVQSSGYGYRLNITILQEACKQPGPVLDLMLRYTQTLIAQITQIAICNRHHTLDKQLCRWLLQCLDRLPGNELIMTQALIANMLGVRREGVTEAAIKLQAEGVIQYSRGHITILDREKLEDHSCECYSIVKRETDRLLHHKLSNSDLGY